ncbi:MAG: thioredoxin domain-containing protein [Bacteroidota bacterium]
MKSTNLGRIGTVFAALLLALLAFLEPQSVAVVFPRQDGGHHSKDTHMDSTRKPNRLLNEKSPYLRQHAYNPVDWHPWGEEAFQKARVEQKPIFLSVGYSTCHWCHVMERESFENDQIAAFLNEHFVSIKVDREERPDVDRIYMTALQAMGQNGGWPMSMFLTPDLKPFYGGTYFPPESRYGRAGFPDVLRRIHEVWEKENTKVAESAYAITGFLEEVAAGPPPGGVPDQDLLDRCYQEFAQTYDPSHGGFGDGPKFPGPSVLDFLMQYYSRSEDRNALMMAETTLREMSLGGIYDHIGGGFHRYSVDGEWRVPHFEKMLYDQAQLVNAYVNLYQITRNPYYATIIRETAEYVLRDLRSPEGAFYSAEDADSPRPENQEEESEGAFYVWSKGEVIEILGKDGETFCEYYGIREEGNALSDPHHEFTGKNILYVAQPSGGGMAVDRADSDESRILLADSRKKLQRMRSSRPRPHRDEKILTSWNGLMIGALARAGVVLGRPDYVVAAAGAATFIWQRLYDTERKLLLRRYRDAESRFEGQLVDYAFLTDGFLALYESSFDVKWLHRAGELSRRQIDLFWDDAQGGFFETSGNDPSVLFRMKEQHDGAEPSGNSVAVTNLIRLSSITDDEGLREHASRSLAAFSVTMEKQPMVMPNMVTALGHYHRSPLQIVVAGRLGDPRTAEMLDQVTGRYLPNKVLLFLGGGEDEAWLKSMVPWIAGYTMSDDRPTAYVCRGFACDLPTSLPEKVGEQIESGSRLR